MTEHSGENQDPRHSMSPRSIVAVDADGTRREVVRTPLRDDYVAPPHSAQTRNDASAEADLTLEPRQWWDRRMSVANNLHYLYWLRLLCLLRGHSFTEWLDYPKYESAWCDRCLVEAQRPLIGR